MITGFERYETETLHVAAAGIAESVRAAARAPEGSLGREIALVMFPVREAMEAELLRRGEQVEELI